MSFVVCGFSLRHHETDPSPGEQHVHGHSRKRFGAGKSREILRAKSSQDDKIVNGMNEAGVPGLYAGGRNWLNGSSLKLGFY